MSGDAQAHLVDLDDALITWAMDKLGSDYTVEKVDASKVHPPPNSPPLICLPAQLQGPEGRRLQGLPPASLSPTIYCPTTHFPPHPSTRSRRSSTPPKYTPPPISLPPTAYLPTAYLLPHPTTWSRRSTHQGMPSTYLPTTHLSPCPTIWSRRLMLPKYAHQLPPCHPPYTSLVPTYLPTTHLPPTYLPLPTVYLPTTHLPPRLTTQLRRSMLPRYDATSLPPTIYLPSAHLPPYHPPTTHLPPTAHRLPPYHPPTSPLNYTVEKVDASKV